MIPRPFSFFLSVFLLNKQSDNSFLFFAKDQNQYEVIKQSSLPWLMCSFLIHGYIWGCVESVTFWGVVGALPAGFSSSRGEALDTQSRLSSSVAPFEFEHGVEHGVVMEFFTALCWDCVSVTGDELATEEHGRESGGGDRDEFPVLFADWLYLTGSTAGVVAAEWLGE